MSYGYQREKSPFRDAGVGALYGLGIGAITGSPGYGAAIGATSGLLFGKQARDLGLPGFGGGAGRRRRHSRGRRHSPSRRHSRVRGGLVTLEASPAPALTAGRRKSRSRMSRSRMSRRRMSRRVRGGNNVVQGGNVPMIVIPLSEIAAQMQADAQLQGGRRRRGRAVRRSRTVRRSRAALRRSRHSRRV